MSKPSREHSHYYQSTSECWLEVWQTVYSKFQVPTPLFLDHLVRQDEAACIFKDDICVGMILFRTVDFNILDYGRDSYFKEWNNADIAALLRHGSRAFLSTYLTVHPNFRAFHSDFRFKEIFLDIMIKRFLASDADVIAGIARRDRGLNDESFKLGARLVRENVEYFGGREHVDLVAFYRHEARQNDRPIIRQISNELWANRVELSQQPRPEVKAA